jgi:hypothetical protein
MSALKAEIPVLVLGGRTRTLPWSVGLLINGAPISNRLFELLTSCNYRAKGALTRQPRALRWADEFRPFEPHLEIPSWHRRNQSFQFRPKAWAIVGGGNAPELDRHHRFRPARAFQDLELWLALFRVNSSLPSRTEAFARRLQCVEALGLQGRKDKGQNGSPFGCNFMTAKRMQFGSPIRNVRIPESRVQLGAPSPNAFQVT